jgi:hypothetical protein
VNEQLIRVGWAEWVSLPDLSIPHIRAKIDTGAKTSALHAFDIRPIERRSGLHVKFETHVKISERQRVVRCEALVVDERRVRSSSGEQEDRYVICTTLRVGRRRWPIEITLTTRDLMRFPMLLGREALQGRLLVDSGHRYLLGRPIKSAKKKPKPKRVK